MKFQKNSSVYHRMTTNNNGCTSVWKREAFLVAAMAVICATAVHLAYFRSVLSSNNIQKSTERKSDNTDLVQRAVRFQKFSVDEFYTNNALRYVAIDSDTEKELSMEDWIRIISDPGSSDLACDLTKLLKEAPFGAYRFETPGVSPETVSETRFEFVVVGDTFLESFAKTPDPEPFAERLSSPSCNASGSEHDGKPAGCVFTNLRKDATLVAPTDWSSASSPSMHSSSYGHLANFLKGAPEQQVLQMWKIVGDTLKDQLLSHSKQRSSAPLWFSTAGSGVAWLHFRLDSRPKYYHYRPFKEYLKTNP